MVVLLATDQTSKEGWELRPMQILRTMTGAGDDSGAIVLMDTILYEDKLWLVPEWLSPQDGGWQTPVRIVCIHGLQYEDISDSKMQGDYLLTYPVPKSVLDGETDTVEGHKYTVIERPEIRFQVGRA